MLTYQPKYWWIMAPLLKKNIAVFHGHHFARETMKKAKPIYHDLLARTEDIGAKNPMASNIYMAEVIIAFYLAADNRLSVEDIRRILHRAFTQGLPHRLLSRINLNKPAFMRKMSQSIQAKAAWAEKHQQLYPTTWQFHFDENKHQDGVYYHFSTCPIAKFCKDNNLIELGKTLCELDYLTIGAMHGVLHRDYTIMEGDTLCDYWIHGDCIETPK